MGSLVLACKQGIIALSNRGTPRMQCWIYKGLKRPDSYLYLDREGDFAHVPKALLDLFGPLELVMQLELGPERRLARANVLEVMDTLRRQGYFIQHQPKDQLLQWASYRDT